MLFLREDFIMNRNFVGLCLLIGTLPTKAIPASHFIHGNMMPLHYAAQAGNVEKIKELLHNHANVNAIDSAGWTPLHHAARAIPMTHKHVKCITKLLLYGAKINAADNNDLTILHHAAICGNIEKLQLFAKLFREHKATMDPVALYGRTPLHFAVSKGHVECAEILIQYGANTALTTIFGTSLAMLATQNGHQKMNSVLNNALHNNNHSSE